MKQEISYKKKVFKIEMNFSYQTIWSQFRSGSIQKMEKSPIEMFHFFHYFWRQRFFWFCSNKRFNFCVKQFRKWKYYWFIIMKINVINYYFEKPIESIGRNLFWNFELKGSAIDCFIKETFTSCGFTEKGAKEGFQI